MDARDVITRQGEPKQMDYYGCARRFGFPLHVAQYYDTWYNILMTWNTSAIVPLATLVNIMMTWQPLLTLHSPLPQAYASYPPTRRASSSTFSRKRNCTQECFGLAFGPRCITTASTRAGPKDTMCVWGIWGIWGMINNNNELPTLAPHEESFIIWEPSRTCTCTAL